MPGSDGFRDSELGDSAFRGSAFRDPELRDSAFRDSAFRDSRGEVESSGVSGRTALSVAIATMAVMIILYELINWRPG